MKQIESNVYTVGGITTKREKQFQLLPKHCNLTSLAECILYTKRSFYKLTIFSNHIIVSSVSIAILILL